MRIPFSKWMPDRFNYNSGLALDAQNVLPAGNSYVPWPNMVVFSVALAAACRGAVLAKTTGGSYTVFACTAAKGYKYVGPSDAWTEITRSSGGDYSLPSDYRWSFDIFGTDLVGVNGADAPQVIDIDNESNFSALGGSPPVASYCKTIGSQLFLFGLVDNPARVQWSGRGNAEYWTSGSRDAGQEDFEAGGAVVGMTSQETGLLFQERAIRRFAPVNSRAVYQFQLVDDDRGLLAPHSLVEVGNTAYFLSEDGFYAYGPQGSRAIGANIIDKWFQSEVEYQRIYSMQGAADPVRQRVFWIFQEDGNTGSYTFDQVLCYDIAADAWTHADISTQHIFRATTPGYTIDTIDDLLTALGYTIETAPFSFDARFLLGGAPYLAAFDEDNKMNFFSGLPLAASVDTVEFQPIPGRRAFINGCYPMTDYDSPVLKVGVKERMQDAFTYSGELAINSRGFTPMRASGRTFSIRMNTDAGDEWSHIQGIDIPDVEITDDGER